MSAAGPTPTVYCAVQPESDDEALQEAQKQLHSLSSSLHDCIHATAHPCRMHRSGPPRAAQSGQSRGRNSSGARRPSSLRERSLGPTSPGEPSRSARRFMRHAELYLTHTSSRKSPRPIPGSQWSEPFGRAVATWLGYDGRTVCTTGQAERRRLRPSSRWHVVVGARALTECAPVTGPGPTARGPRVVRLRLSCRGRSPGRAGSSSVGATPVTIGCRGNTGRPRPSSE